ncbi:MAG: hypothetical protein APF81_11295 [Desulfosporosinus sp. BRH_c37]|nr:MAG: hypothetical protein APF81_11295 [Desulfosporosinus sp. BRH_c37]
MKKEILRWFILVQLFISVGCTGGVYAWSVFSKPLMKLHGWTGPEVTLAYSCILVCVALVGIVGGRFLDRFGPKYLMLGAGILFGSGWFLVGYADTLLKLYLFFGVIGGIGDGLLYQTSVTTATRWFPERKGLAAGIVVGAAGLAPVVIAPLANWVLTNYGVLNAFKFFGVLFLIIRVAGFWIVIDPPVGWKPEGYVPPAVTATTISTGLDYGPKEMMKDKRFYMLWFTYLCGCVSGLLLISQASGLAQELAHLTAAQAAALGVGVLAICNFVGRSGMGFLSDKIGRFKTLSIIFITTAVMMLLFRQAHSYGTYVPVLAITGVCFGGLLATFPSITGEMFGMRRMGSNYGIMFTAYGTAAIVGPMVGAWCKQLTGNYNLAFVFSACLALIAFILIFTLNNMEKNRRMSLGGGIKA